MSTKTTTQAELTLYDAKGKQGQSILQIFADRPGEWLTPFHVQSILGAKTGLTPPITSVRSWITKYTKAGRLLKSATASRKGIYKVPNHVWTIAI